MACFLDSGDRGTSITVPEKQPVMRFETPSRNMQFVLAVMILAPVESLDLLRARKPELIRSGPRTF
jgi:hypothetical protein